MSGAQTDHGLQISAFPPIGDYAFLSDCETTAPVAPNGNVEWLCLPRMDSPSVFAAILDRDAGGFRVGPADVNVPAGRRYVPGTMVVETSWETRLGWVVVRDALCIGPWHHDTERSRSHRRSPTDHDADHVLLRMIECVEVAADRGARLARIRHDERMATRWEEARFTICSFWLVSALAEIGEFARVRGLCEKLLSLASPLALYAEEIDAATGRHLGNFPPGVHPPGVDQCRGAHHPRRAGARAGRAGARSRARRSMTLSST